MTALSLQLRYYAAAISIMAAVEARFAESKAPLVELSEAHDGFTIHAVCGEYEGEDVQGFIIFDTDGEVLDAGGYFNDLLEEIIAIAAAEAAELDLVGFEEGDEIRLETAEGVDAQGYLVTVAREYGVNADNEVTQTVTRTVSNGEGLESGSITVIATDSDGTRFIDSVTDLDGNSIASAEGDDDIDGATPAVVIFVAVVASYSASA